MAFKEIANAAGSILNFAGGMLNSRWNRKQSQRNTKMTIQANKEMAEYAYAKDLEMWKLQNLYNDPSSQMKRLENAGLNPNLVYGANAPGNQSGPPPKYNAPNIDYSGVQPRKLPSLMLLQDMRMKEAQIDNVKAATNNTNERTINEKIAQVLGLTEANVAKGTAQHQVEAAALNNKRTQAMIQTELQRVRNLQAEERVKWLDGILRKSQIKKSDEDVEYMKWKNKIREWNVTDNDPAWLRQLMMWILENKSKGGQALDTILDGMK